jgi:hypothetical protein
MRSVTGLYTAPIRLLLRYVCAIYLNSAILNSYVLWTQKHLSLMVSKNGKRRRRPMFLHQLGVDLLMPPVKKDCTRHSTSYKSQERCFKATTYCLQGASDEPAKNGIASLPGPSFPRPKFSGPQHTGPLAKKIGCANLDTHTHTPTHEHVIIVQEMTVQEMTVQKMTCNHTGGHRPTTSSSRASAA